jgi:hypothetical protein
LLLLLFAEAIGFFYVRWHWKGGKPLLYSRARLVTAAAALLLRLACIWCLWYRSVAPFALVLAVVLIFLALLGPPRDLAYMAWGGSRDPDHPRWHSDPIFRDWLLVTSWSAAWTVQIGLVLLLVHGGAPW